MSRPVLQAGSISDILKKHGAGGDKQQGGAAKYDNVVLGSWGPWLLVYGKWWNLVVDRKTPVCSLQLRIQDDPAIWVMFTRWEDTPTSADFSMTFHGVDVTRAEFAGSDTFEMSLTQGAAFPPRDADIGAALLSGRPAEMRVSVRKGNGAPSGLPIALDGFEEGYARLKDSCEPTETFDPSK